MRKITTYLVASLAMLSVFGGCSRKNIIPDRDLRNIFKDIYLTNSYLEQHRNRVISLHVDSLDMYRPILADYGYTVSDFRNTINTFSTRKSSRLSDVVDEVIQQLEKDVEWYKYYTAALDSIDAISLRMFRNLVYEDSVITVSRIRDTANLRIILPVSAGNYEISYGYFLDSLDKNKNLKTTVTVLSENARPRTVTTNWMASARNSTYKADFDTSDLDTAMVVLFGNYPTDDLKRPEIRIDTLRIYHTLPIQIARDSAALQIYRYRLLFDAKDEEQPADSLSLSSYSEGTIEERDSDN